MRIGYYLVDTVGFDGEIHFKTEDWGLYVSVVICSLLGVMVGSKAFENMKDSQESIRAVLTIFLVLCGASLLLRGAIPK
jgi:uncharacterized membrane protein YfcA